MLTGTRLAHRNRPSRTWSWLLLLTCIVLAPNFFTQASGNHRHTALAASTAGSVAVRSARPKRTGSSSAAVSFRGTAAANTAAVNGKPSAPDPAARSPANGSAAGNPQPQKQLRIPREEWLRRRKAVKDSRCPANCTMYGTCNEELGRCDCPRHRDGLNCGHVLTGSALETRCRQQGYEGDVKDCLNKDQSCVNGCNGRGKCVAGFCHCAPGYYGSDCALSLGSDGAPVLLAGAGYQTRQKRPWVYVYELPPKLAVWFNFRRLDRLLHLYFWQRLLGSGARTADGDRADYFFIPVRQRCYGDTWVLREAVEHLRSAHPWWNRTGGSRHLVMHTGDWGLGEVAEDVRQIGWNMSWLTYWGLSVDRPEVQRWSRAFRQERDVVLPVYISPGHFVQFGMIRSPLRPTARQRPRNASTLFFAGRICHNPRFPDHTTFPRCGDDTTEWYGAGIREKFFVSHWNRSGFHVVRSEPQYGTYMARSTYCLAPPGAGHGQRQIQALFMGCVPVVVGDGVAEPFEPAVSWERWGVRLREEMIPRAHEVLKAVGEEELAAKQARMHCAAQHMLYSSITGAVLSEDGRYDAFETTLEVLRVRADHPAAHQRDFTRLDPDFAAFMDCRPPPGFKWLNATVERQMAAPVSAKAAAASAAVATEIADGVAAATEGAGVGAALGVEGPLEQQQLGEGDQEEGERRGSYMIAQDGGSGTWANASFPVAVASGSPSPTSVPLASSPPPGVQLHPALCSHAARDMRHRERGCYQFLRGGGYMGVPGGAMCAKGFRTRLAACPRLWG